VIRAFVGERTRRTRKPMVEQPSHVTRLIQQVPPPPPNTVAALLDHHQDGRVVLIEEQFLP
jgi:hypothetical protein